MTTAQRKSTNISLSADVVREAKALGVNISRASEQGVVAEISAIRKARWVEENWDAIQERNHWVEKHGLPLEKHRMF